jgi:signal transduction histidine kinase
MKKISIILLILLSISSFSQQKSDSLIELLKTTKDTARLEILMQLCWDKRYYQPVEAMEYGLDALTLAWLYNLPEKKAIIYNYLGVVQRNFGDYANALEYYFLALKEAEEQGLDEQIAYAYNNIGDIYNREGKYERAIEYELKALAVFEMIDNKTGISYCCHQIALVYYSLEEYSKALEYDYKSLEIREAMGNRAGMGYSLISIGEIFMVKKEFSTAKEKLLQSLEIFTELEDDFGLAYSNYSLGIYYRNVGNLEKAESHFKKALGIGKEIKSQIRIKSTAKELSEIYAIQKKYKTAYEMYMLYKETDDSLYRNENLIKITQLESQYEYQQKLKEQEFEQSQRELMQIAEISRHKTSRNFMIISSILFLIIVIVLYHSNSTKRKSNLHLVEKNTEIESQNDEIQSQKNHLLSLNSKLEKQKNELEETLQELTTAQTQLMQSEKMASIGQLTAGVAHELNNPINFIHGNVKPLQRDIEEIFEVIRKYESIIQEKKLQNEFDEITSLKKQLDYNFLVKEITDLLDGINEGSNRTSDIVKGLRTFSRLDETEYVFADIHEIINSTLTILNNKIDNRITIQKVYGEIGLIECMPSKLNQVFMNILSNAIEAIQDKGNITIKTTKNENHIRVSICDTGQGISNETIKHIFDPFYTTKDVGTGTGLGLSISLGIINNHNGDIDVISDIGKGTEFIIKLPIQQT